MTTYEGQAIITYPGSYGELSGIFKRRTRILLKRTAPGVYDVTSNANLRQAAEVTISLPNGQTYSGKVLCQTGSTATIVSSNDEPSYQTIGDSHG
ncbi:hypothetical protein [Pseudomonas sp. 2023EL-01195]|uniref:hypothetical protein n=1 Tax=Pseudomonas sp. 2023EL-01195 TaxID=3088134 RepID=UPI00296AB70C|nr:hypothetical protein [Pseudomonas sp. 2023EL-01195]MDW3716595.1 hypothetical protein [Pseudomonas sp. 2023EL-01195]